MKVKDSVVVVTGAGSGIGRELALKLLAQGARVAGADFNEASLKETGMLAKRYNGAFASFVVNVTDRDTVSALPEKVVERLGAVDIVINNAGVIQPFLKLHELDSATIDRVFGVNFFGTLYMTKAFLPHLLTRPEAHIVNLSSMGGFIPVPGQTIYCAAKAAVKLMSEGLASELIDTKVHVSVVCPGAVATNIRENSGLGSPKQTASGSGIEPLSATEAAGIIVRGIVRNKYHIFVGKDAMMMDKLYRLNPAFAARTVAKKMRSLSPT